MCFVSVDKASNFSECVELGAEEFDIFVQDVC